MEQSNLQQRQDEHAESEVKAFDTRRRDILQTQADLEPGSQTFFNHENETRSPDIRQQLADIEPGAETSENNKTREEQHEKQRPLEPGGETTFKSKQFETRGRDIHQK